MRNFMLLISCFPLVCCGLVHRTANVARTIVSENHDPLLKDTTYLMAFALSPANPVIDVIPQPPPVEKSAEELNKIKPAAEEEDPALYLPSGEVFDPICLLNNIGSIEIPIHPTVGCGRENIHPLTPKPQISTDKKRIYIEYTLDEDPLVKAAKEEEDAKKAAEDKKNGIITKVPPEKATEPVNKINEISYKNLGTVDGLFAIYFINTLSTGEVITSLGLYDFSIDSESKDTLERRKNYGEGDRCNSGVSNLNFESSEELYYSVNHSPQSLLTLPYIKDEQEILTLAPILDGFLDCPTCCVGTNDFIKNISSGFTISPSYITYIEKQRIIDKEQKNLKLEKLDNSAENKEKENKSNKILPQTCFDNLLYKIFKSGHTTLTNQELEDFIKGVENNCYANKKAKEDRSLFINTEKPD